MKNGLYELVVAPAGYSGKRYRDRYCYEHHLVWWENTGTLPGEGEVIHHKNDQKRDNRFENLELKTTQDHSSDHQKEKLKAIGVFRCPSCDTVFERSRRKSSLARKRQSLTFCSRLCIGRFFHPGRSLSSEELQAAREMNLIEEKQVPRGSTGQAP